MRRLQYFCLIALLLVSCAKPEQQEKGQAISLTDITVTSKSYYQIQYDRQILIYNKINDLIQEIDERKEMGDKEVNNIKLYDEMPASLPGGIILDPLHAGIPGILKSEQSIKIVSCNVWADQKKYCIYVETGLFNPSKNTAYVQVTARDMGIYGDNSVYQGKKDIGIAPGETVWIRYSEPGLEAQSRFLEGDVMSYTGSHAFIEFFPMNHVISSNDSFRYFKILGQLYSQARPLSKITGGVITLTHASDLYEGEYGTVFPESDDGAYKYLTLASDLGARKQQTRIINPYEYDYYLYKSMPPMINRLQPEMEAIKSLKDEFSQDCLSDGILSYGNKWISDGSFPQVLSYRFKPGQKVHSVDILLNETGFWGEQGLNDLSPGYFLLLLTDQYTNLVYTNRVEARGKGFHHISFSPAAGLKQAEVVFPSDCGQTLIRIHEIMWQ